MFCSEKLTSEESSGVKPYLCTAQIRLNLPNFLPHQFQNVPVALSIDSMALWGRILGAQKTRIFQLNKNSDVTQHCLGKVSASPATCWGATEIVQELSDTTTQR